MVWMAHGNAILLGWREGASHSSEAAAVCVRVAGGYVSQAEKSVDRQAMKAMEVPPYWEERAIRGLSSACSS
jgi:hypothetical protein